MTSIVEDIRKQFLCKRSKGSKHELDFVTGNFLEFRRFCMDNGLVFSHPEWLDEGRVFQGSDADTEESSAAHKVGDVVQLKSGGPKMTVTDYERGGYVDCQWHDKNLFIAEESFPLECLRKVDVG